MTPKSKSGKTCHVICQSHIDMAWLWRWEETIGFIRETFGGEIDLLDNHPDYTYCQSQLIAYMAAQERFPELFEKIRQYVREGRWEVVGGELVESDHLIPGGESLVRQFLYGQLYARGELGVQAAVGWSPDSFGHSGNLPQILAKSGIESFVYKRPLVGEQDVPVTPFWWEGIDGTRVLAYRTTNKGWDFVNPISDDLVERHNLRQTWGYSGTGDRGGVRPYKDLGEDEHGKHIYSTPSRYFEAVREEAKDIPVFAGELNYCYEGTYTTHADAKTANRRCENRLYLAESLAAAAHLEGVPYPAQELAEAWRILAFHQFHDILPGTSIPEVYEDAGEAYARLEEMIDDVVARSAAAFVDGQDDGSIAVYNPLTFARSADVEVQHGHSFRAADLPPSGFRTFELTRTEAPDAPRPTGLVLDNGLLRVSVSPETGWIDSLVDLRIDREVLAEPGGNVLTLWKEDSFETPGAEEWNAWDIGVSEESERADQATEPARVGESSIKCQHTWGGSAFTSLISLPPGEDYVEIALECDWRETLVMLRTESSLDLQPEAEAWHEIPYGAVRRDKTGAEVPSWRWVDVSDSLYGAALINDSRCGHSVKGNALRMTLLRCATNPDPVSDRGTFSFKYRLFPHSGTWREAGVVEQSYDLNVPVAVFGGAAKAQPGLPAISGSGVYLGACKLSEDGASLVLRLHEAHGQQAHARLRTGSRFSQACEANMLEDVERRARISDGHVNLSFTPFEIKTVLLGIP